MHKTGIAWYQPEHWQRLLEISSDKSDLEDTYEEWLDQAEDKFRRIRNAGIDVIKIFINPDELKSWCEDKDLEINSESRSNFAAFKLQELFSE